MEYLHTSLPGFAARFAGEADTKLVLQMIRDLAAYEKLEDQVEATEEILHTSLFVKKQAEVIIGEYEGETAGYALYFHNFSTFAGRGGLYLEDLFVYERFRGKGIGREYFNLLARIAKERGCPRVEWLCLDWNVNSIAFYKGLGARPVDGWTVYRLTEPEIGALAKKSTT